MTLASRLGLGRLRRAWTRWRRPVNLAAWTSPGPVSRVFGLDRGLPIDRHYIERFLGANADSIQGRVLEVGDRNYTERFGGSRVSASDVLHPVEGAPGATVIGDLTRLGTLPERVYDCFLCTQTLNFVLDPAQALRGARRVLKPGGLLLLTVGGISQISRFDADRWGMYWGFTSQSLGRLLDTAFPGAHAIATYGNALAATAFLNGVSVEDLPRPELLDDGDPDYPVILAAVATRERDA